MRVLVTGAHSFLGRALVMALGREHDVKTLDLAGDGLDFAGDPRDRDFAETATKDAEIVVHIAPHAPTDSSPTDLLDCATRGTYNLITTANTCQRFILISSLRLFERYPMTTLVTEQYAPRPTTDPDGLAIYLAEATAKEVARVASFKVVALRLGEVVDDALIRGRTPDPRWLHVEDAVHAVKRAIDFAPSMYELDVHWWVYHIVGAGTRTRFPLATAGQDQFGYKPAHDLTAGVTVPTELPAAPVRRKLTGKVGGAARKVAIYGAGGPLAAAVTAAIEHDHVLRLTDVRPLPDIVAEGTPQSPDAPFPHLLESPHEMRAVDVADYDQVLESARGMDALINCTVVRPHPVQAFRVNTLGAYHVVRAAAELGIRRVVHTGPQLVTLNHPAGYWYDHDLVDDVPQRPGLNLYSLSKYLGQEICRIFADEYDLEVPTLVFSLFVNPKSPQPKPLGTFAMSISWDDAGQALRQALRAHSFPRPFELMVIVADIPHSKYLNAKAKRLLNWQPRDTLEAHWTRDLS